MVTETLRLRMGTGYHRPPRDGVPVPDHYARSSASSVVNTGHSGVDGTISTAGLPGIVTTVHRVPPAMMRATTRKHFLIRDYEIFSLNDDEAISLFQISLNDYIFLLIRGGAHKQPTH